jgi:ribosome biogenesis protein MAK21
MASNHQNQQGDKAPRRRGVKGKTETGGGPQQSGSNKTNNFAKNHTTQSHQHKSLLIVLNEGCRGWYDAANNTPGRNDVVSKPQQNKELVQHFRQQADDLFANEEALYKSKRHADRSSDDQWVEQTTRHGTLKDRVAAMSVLIGEHPVHQLSTLDQLLHMASGGSNGQQRVSQMAGEALADLFTHTYLPADRKLIALSSRPLHEYYHPVIDQKNAKNKRTPDKQKTLSPRVLLLWRFEDYIKQRYATLLSLLSTWLNDQLELHKLFAVRTTIQLLSERPESEAVLLQMCVNKLGDPDKKVAAGASHQLRHMIHIDHPAMTDVVAREVQQLAFRPHISAKVLYGCVVFLNQLKLQRVASYDCDENSSQRSQKDPLPVALVKTYFRLFEVVVAATSREAVEEATKRAKKSKKSKKSRRPVNKKVASTSALLAAPGSKATMEMKGRLLSALLTGVNRAHPYLPKSYQSMEEHMDILYRMVHQSPPAAATQALMLLFHLVVGVNTTSEEANEAPTNGPTAMKLSPQQERAMDRYYRVLYAKLSDVNMFSGKQHLTMFFNLVYKSMKYDTQESRIVALAKRLIHIAYHTKPSNAAVLSACLFLLSEVVKAHPTLQTVSMEQCLATKLDASSREPLGAFLPISTEGKTTDANSKPQQVSSSLWEVTLLTSHFHPSVVKFTDSLLKNDGESGIDYKGDPLKDFTLGPFLDRFAYRHPKERLKKKDGEEEGEGKDDRDTIAGRRARSSATSTVVVNDPSFLKSKAADVPEDFHFFRKYFEERAKRDEVKGVVRTVSTKGQHDDFSDDDQSDAEDQDLDAQKSDADVNVDDVSCLTTVYGMVIMVLVFAHFFSHSFHHLPVQIDWDSDPEEEVFAHSVAIKLMEKEGSNGQAHFDNEDPDTADWSDYEGSDNHDVAQEFDVDISEDDISMNNDEDDDSDNSDSDNSAGEVDFDPDDDDVDIDDDVSDGASRGSDEGDYDDFMDDASSGSDGDEDDFGAADIDPFDKDDGSGTGDDSEDAAVASAWASDDSEDDDDSAGGDEEGRSTQKQPQPRRAKVLSSGLALADADDYETLIAEAMQAREEKDTKGSSKAKSNNKRKTSTATSSGNKANTQKSTTSNKIAKKRNNQGSKR